MNLQDKVVLITGAATGIGRAAARLFAQEGARIVVAGPGYLELTTEEAYDLAMANSRYSSHKKRVPI